MKRLLAFAGFCVLLVVVMGATAGEIDGFPLRVTDVPTNGTYTSASHAGAIGWIESVEIWPGTAGVTFTGSVWLAVIYTNGADGLDATTVLYSNDTVIARTVMQPRRNVHAITSGTATNTGTIMARYLLTGTEIVRLYARNTVLATNKNVSAYIVLDN